MFKRVFLSISLATVVSAWQQPDNTEKNKRDRDGTTMTAEKQGNSKSDVDLLARIRRAITKDASMSTGARNVKIVVNGGQVWLRGPVASDAEKEQIGAAAKQLAGDANVNNLLEVSKGDK